MSRSCCAYEAPALHMCIMLLHLRAHQVTTQAPFTLPRVLKHSFTDFTLVVARCIEDVTWLRGFIRAFNPKSVYVYEHCNHTIDKDRQSDMTAESTTEIIDVPLNPNEAFECHCYLKFIVSQYHQLPSQIMFLQVSPASTLITAWTRQRKRLKVCWEFSVFARRILSTGYSSFLLPSRLVCSRASMCVYVWLQVLRQSQIQSQSQGQGQGQSRQVAM